MDCVHQKYCLSFTVLITSIIFQINKTPLKIVTIPNINASIIIFLYISNHYGLVRWSSQWVIKSFIQHIYQLIRERIDS